MSDAESPTVYCEEDVKARKQHRCCECRGFIQPGEIYHRHSGLWDGEWNTFKVCLDCDAIMHEINEEGKKVHEEPVSFEGLFDCVVQYYNKNYLLRFVAICDKRGGKVPEWVREEVKKCQP